MDILGKHLINLYLNTSHVKVNPTSSQNISKVSFYLNTSHVKVNPV